jgi:hypothetical protein
MALNQQVHVPVIAVQDYPVKVVCLVNLEGGMMMDAWKQSAACQGIEPGGGIPPWDEDALPGVAVLVPLHGNPVRSVFRGDAQEGRQETGPDVLEPDQTDSGHACPVDHLGSEGCGENPSQNIGVHPEVDQDSAVDEATDDRDLHGWLLARLTAKEDGG